MTSEKEKMLAGELYDPLDPELSQERLRCRTLLKAFNDTGEGQSKERTQRTFLPPPWPVRLDGK